MSNLAFCILWFGLVYWGTYYVVRKDDLFAPIKFITLLYILRNLSYLVVLYFDETTFPDYVLQSIGTDLENALPQYTLVQTLAFSSLLLGIIIINKRPLHRKFITLNDYRALHKTSYILYILALVGYVKFLFDVGGLYNLISNLDSRIELQSGAYSLIFRDLFIFGIIIRIKLYGVNKSIVNKILVAVFILTAILASSSLGGRRGSVFIILVALTSYHFYVSKIVVKKINKVRALLLVLGLTMYTFLIPALRSNRGLERIVEGELNVFDEVDAGELVSYFSYTYIDIFAANYFNANNRWNFTTLWTIPLNLDVTRPRHMRPPIDEGVYFYNIARYNLELTPPTERYRMHLVSMPIENFGFGYANGLIPGVILSFFGLGVIYKYSYNIFLGSALNPMVLFLYLFVLFTFNFSSLRIMNLIYLMLNIGITLIVYSFFRFVYR